VSSGREQEKSGHSCDSAVATSQSICTSTAVKRHASFKMAFRISTGSSRSCLGRVALSDSAVTTPSTS
jgi:hypothetical protein